MTIFLLPVLIVGAVAAAVVGLRLAENGIGGLLLVLGALSAPWAAAMLVNVSIFAPVYWIQKKMKVRAMRKNQLGGS